MYIIGANGYIGQRLMERLQQSGREGVVGIDPCILSPPRFGVTKARVEDIEIPKGEDVIWLASLQDFPGFEKLTVGERLEWAQVARNLMIELPLKWAQRSRSFLYVSSMRALTHQSTFYGGFKRRAEAVLLEQSDSARIVRFGTVHGGISRELYNRTITVPNRWLCYGILPDEKWSAYVTEMWRVLDLLTERPDAAQVGTVINLVDAPRRPWNRDALEAYLAPGSFRNILTPEPHPAELTAAFYNLPWPA